MAASGVNQTEEPEEGEIINCVAMFMTKEKAERTFVRRTKFCCKVNKSEKRLVKLRETIW